MRKKTNKLYVLPVLCILIAFAYITGILWDGYTFQDDFSIAFEVLLILWAGIYLAVSAKHHSESAMIIHGILFFLIFAFKTFMLIFSLRISYELSHGVELDRRIIPTLPAGMGLNR